MPEDTAFTEFTPKRDWQLPFLTHLAKTANVRAACKVARISRVLAYRVRKEDAEFAEAWQHSLDDALDDLEGEGMRRAKKASDTLLIFFLKSHRPDTYREQSQQNLSGDVNIHVIHDKPGPTEKD